MTFRVEVQEAQRELLLLRVKRGGSTGMIRPVCRRGRTRGKAREDTMPLYFSAHTTACLTKQALKELMRTLLNAEEVKVRRCLASQIGGRMLTEVEAPDLPALENFYKSRHVNCEWIMRIDLDAQGGGLTEH